MFEGLGILHNTSKSPPEKVFSEVGMEGFETSALFLTEKENKYEITIQSLLIFFLFFFNSLYFKDTLGKPPAKEIPLVDHCKYK